MQFTPRQLDTTLKLVRAELRHEQAHRLALDRLANHGDSRAIDRAIKDLQSDKIWRSR